MTRAICTFDLDCGDSRGRHGLNASVKHSTSHFYCAIRNPYKSTCFATALLWFVDVFSYRLTIYPGQKQDIDIGRTSSEAQLRTSYGSLVPDYFPGAPEKQRDSKEWQSMLIH